MMLRVFTFAGALLALAGAATLPAQAQADLIKFGKLEAKEFDDKNFAGDTAAEAVVMGDIGRSHFEVLQNDFKVVFERVTRIKILKKAGYEWATVEVPLYRRNGNEERLGNLRGFTYNLENGQLVKTKLESSGIFAEQVDANHMVRKFTLPNVKEGSVVEFTYTITSDFVFNFQDWQFQHSIPVRWSEYRATIPEYFDYRMLMQGYEPLEVADKSESNTQFTFRGNNGLETLSPSTTLYRWAMKDVPAFRNEPFITTTQDYVSRIEFELRGTKFPNSPYEEHMGSWDKVNTELLNDDNFGAQLNRTGFLKNELAAIVAKYPELPGRAAAIHHLVSSNLKFNGQDRLYSMTGIRKAYEQHSGNSADINLLLIGLLREAGLTADPIILSTRDHGRLDESIPMVSRCNYVLAAVQLPNQEGMLLLDATQPHADFGMLPERCLNTRGRLVTSQKRDNYWLTIASSQRYVHYQAAQLTLNEQGGWKGKVHDEHGGYQALAERASLQQLGEKKYIENSYLKEKEGWTVAKYAVQHATTPSKPLAVDIDVETEGAAASGGVLYVSPMTSFGEEANPFKAENRRFPVDLGAAREEIVMLTLALPDGYEVQELPQSANIALPDNGGRFQYAINPVGSNLQVVSRILLTKPFYSAEEYGNLRQFYSMVVAKHAERIVLKKKS